MSEKVKSPESAFGFKHSNWVDNAKAEGGSLFLGAAGGYLGKKALMLLGISNPLLLAVGITAAAIGGYVFGKKNL